MGILERIEHRDALECAEASGLYESVAVSRRRAARQIFEGSLLVCGSVGLGLLAGFGTFGGATLLVTLGATVVGGVGLVQIGRAARHARRYGSTKSLLAFEAAAGLGLASIGFAVANWFYSTGATPGWVAGTAMLLAVEFAVLLVLLTLRTLLRWASEP